jgi:hypothetical protein
MEYMTICLKKKDLRKLDKTNKFVRKIIVYDVGKMLKELKQGSKKKKFKLTISIYDPLKKRR